MEEKYYVINNADQYYILIKCTGQQLSDYVQYGHKNCLTDENAINLFRLSEWLINRRIKHTMIFGQIDNIILKAFIKKDINTLLKEAAQYNLVIENDEVENLLRMGEDHKSKLFW